jgi:hypothetical protein
MTKRWEVCFLRPAVGKGAKMFFVHPDNSKNLVFRDLRDFLDARKIEVPVAADMVLSIISSLLMDGWEPMSIHGPFLENYPGLIPDLGPTGYSFRRLVN